MKKLISSALITSSVFASAQVTFAVKGNLFYKADKPSWTNIKNGVTSEIANQGKNNIGYNGGISAKIDTPVGIFIMPEAYYTTFSSEVTVPNTSTTIQVKNNRVDVPVLVGYNVLGQLLGIYAGPVASYNLAQEKQYNDFKENAFKKFTVGYQIGAQAKISRIILSARYESSFSNEQRDFINQNITSLSNVIRYDSRPSIILVGLGFTLN